VGRIITPESVPHHLAKSHIQGPSTDRLVSKGTATKKQHAIIGTLYLVAKGPHFITFFRSIVHARCWCRHQRLVWWYIICLVYLPILDYYNFSDSVRVVLLLFFLRLLQLNTHCWLWFVLLSMKILRNISYRFWDCLLCWQLTRWVVETFEKSFYCSNNDNTTIFWRDDSW